MNRKLVFAVLLGSAMCAAPGVRSLGQDPEATGLPQRPYLLQTTNEGSMQVGDWNGDSSFRAYAKTHPGNYVVFMADGKIYRMDKPENLAELQRLYAPMHALGQQQAALGRQQAALGQEQGNLGRQMSGARYDPNVAQALGEQQGNLGRTQGTLGEQQGNLGRQQAVYSKKLYRRVEEMIDACMRDHSCAVVAQQSNG